MPKNRLRGRWIVLAGLLGAAVLTAALVVDRRISDAQVQDASDELFLLMTLRQGALGSYFDTVRAELTFWSLSDDLREDLVRLREAWKKIPGDPRLSLQAGYIHDNPFGTHERRELARNVARDRHRYGEEHDVRGTHERGDLALIARFQNVDQMFHCFSVKIFCSFFLRSV